MRRTILTIIGLSVLFLSANLASAQTDTIPKKRLKSPTKVSGFIGGESHDSYVIRARKGQTMTVQISWKREDDNRAEFSVSRSANFFSGEPVKFGDGKGKIWRGKIPVTANYYIYVVAHPTAKYTLRVNLSN